MVLNVFVLCSCRCSTKSTLARYPFGDCVCVNVLCVVWVWVWVWVCDLSLSLSVCMSVGLSLSLSLSLSVCCLNAYWRCMQVCVRACVRACVRVLYSKAMPTSVNMRKYVHHTYTHIYV
jgi:hypothetical protein